MSFSYDRYERRQSSRAGGAGQRSGLGYWLPLVLTVTVATAGLAAWAWNERKDYDEEDDDRQIRRSKERRKYEEAGPLAPGSSNAPPVAFPGPSGYVDETVETSERRTYTSEERDYVEMRDTEQTGTNESFVSRAIRRTPSPQQFFDGASKRVAAGVAAAGAMMGGALGAIREEEKDDFVDHERWSEEADHQDRDIVRPVLSATGNVIGVTPGAPPAVASARSRGGQMSLGRGKRRMVAVVVSADADDAQLLDPAASYRSEHASILSHLTTVVNSDTTQLIVLIYAPHLNPSSSAYSTPTAITPATTPGAELASLDPQPYLGKTSSRDPPLYTSLYKESIELVGRDGPTSVIPFSTPTGHVHLLRHLGPSVVYLQESLSNAPGSTTVGAGEAVSQINGWVGQIVIVVGDHLGGGLVDTETEDEGGDAARRQSRTADGSSAKWWQDETRVGLGKGVEVVEGLRVEEDWAKRINGGS